MILVDTSVWIDFFRNRDTPEVERLDSLFATTQLAIGDLILTEILQGFHSNLDFERTRKMLSTLSAFRLGGEDVAVSAARNYRALRLRGITIRKTIDTIIATFCISEGHALLFSDRDFQPFVDHLGLVDAMRLSNGSS